MRRSTCLAAVLAAGLTGATSAMAGLLYEPGNYAAQGNLLLQLDGIRNVAPLRAHDGQATTWRDLSSSCNLLAFEDAHATANVVSEWAADGYTFGGGAYGKLQRTLNVGSAFTVQIVCDVTPSAQETNYPSLFGAADDKCNFYTYGKGTTLNFKSVKGGRVQCAGWTGRYVTGLYNKAKAVVFHAASGTVEEGTDATSVGNQTYCVGSVFKSTDANHAVERYLNGTIKAVRVYNKVLTEAELEQNRALDDARFFDGIPVTNVVVATAVAGAEGNEGSGAYAFDADGYTFSAPQRTVLDGATYACAGYTLETWDGSAWSAPAAYSSCSYAATDTSAKVRLTWQWVRAPGEAPAAFDTTLGDYVTDGLVFHIDGIRNAGAGQPHDPNAVGWTDLVSGNTSVLKHDKSDGSGWLADGYFFGGASYAEFTERLTGLTNTVTVQVVCDVNPLLLEGTSKWPMLVGCNDNDTCNLYYELNGTSHRLTFKNANGGHAKMEAKTWGGRYGTAIRDGTTNYIFQTTRIADAMTAAAASGNIGTAAVRVGSAGSTPALRRDRWFTGIIKAVRIYDRVLTDEELEQNRAVDEARFFGAEPPEPNVEMASSVRGLPLGEPEGAYALPPEGYTFTAPASVTRGEDTYSCTGYTLETWDEATGAWGAPEAHDGVLACALSDMAARVRLTWQWTHTAGPGYDAAFDDYVADGLVLHLDGIRNAGLAPARDTGSAAWADIGSVGGYARFVHNAADGSAWTADGYAFGGTSYAVMNGVRTLGTAFTAQVVSEVDSYVNCRTAMVWPGLIGTTAGSGDPFPMYMNNNNSNKASVNCKVGGTNVGIYINDWAGEYATAWSDGVNASLFDTVKAASTTPFVHAAGTRTFTVGGGNGGTPGYATRYLLGAIKAVRLYGRALTDAELARNRAADEARLFARAPTAATGEVVVRSSEPGLSGDRPNGMYRPAGAYVFSAPPEAPLDGVPYELTGYTLEAWNAAEGAWGEPVSYEGSSCTPPYATASQRLTWQWKIKSRLTKIRDDYDVGDYVQNGLYLHLDGIRNAGKTADHDDAATTWANLGTGGANFNAVFDYATDESANYGWSANGYAFVYGGKFARLSANPNFGNVVTIQLVGRFDGGTAAYPTFFGSSNDFCNVYTVRAGANAYFKTFNSTRTTVQPVDSWEGKYVTALWLKGKYVAIQDAVPARDAWGGTWHSKADEFKSVPFYVGGIFKDENDPGYANERRFTGTVHAVRVYKRILTDAELAQNREVDEARFFGNFPASNVTIAHGRYDASVEAAGDYRVDGTYTFAAEGVTVDGKTLLPAGCKIEAWDGSAWGAPTFVPGSSYTYTEGVSPAKVRLTWQWTGNGTVLIVR